MAPPPPNYLALGEQYFEAGDYAQAADAYNAYLRANPLGPNVDQALFRLALSYAFPESPVRDLQRSSELLSQLVSQYPHSLFKSPAEFLLRQQTELARQQSELLRQQSELTLQQSEVENLRAELGRRESQIQGLHQEIEKIRQVDLQRLRADVGRREERIRQLTEELEKLKQIDLQRRPSVPPR